MKENCTYMSMLIESQNLCLFLNTSIFTVTPLPKPRNRIMLKCLSTTTMDLELEISHQTEIYKPQFINQAAVPSRVITDIVYIKSLGEHRSVVSKIVFDCWQVRDNRGHRKSEVMAMWNQEASALLKQIHFVEENQQRIYRELLVLLYISLT